MRRSSSRIAGAVAGPAMLLVAACNQGPLPPAGTAPDPEPPRQTLASALAQCDIDHDYDPSAALPEDALGEGEQEWRACAHAAIERVLRPDLRAQAELDGLLAEDERLTAAIAAGAATRTERAAAVGAAAAALQEREDAIRAEELSQMSAAELLSSLRTNSEGRRVHDDIGLIAETL